MREARPHGAALLQRPRHVPEPSRRLISLTFSPITIEKTVNADLRYVQLLSNSSCLIHESLFDKDCHGQDYGSVTHPARALLIEAFRPSTYLHRCANGDISRHGPMKVGSLKGLGLITAPCDDNWGMQDFTASSQPCCQDGSFRIKVRICVARCKSVGSSEGLVNLLIAHGHQRVRSGSSVKVRNLQTKIKPVGPSEQSSIAANSQPSPHRAEQSW